MAKRAGTASNTFRKGGKKRRGVHAKTKTSRIKHSKFYKKKYRGQGR